MSVEIENVVTQRRTSGNTAAAEIWIAYLHLMKAKGAVKDQGMVNELQGLMDTALAAFRRYHSNSAQTPGREGPPY